MNLNLIDILTESPFTTLGPPPDVDTWAGRPYYPIDECTIKFSRFAGDSKYSSDIVQLNISHNDPASNPIPDGWDGSQYCYLPIGSRVDPMFAGEDEYHERERLFAVLEINGEDFYTWFMIKDDGVLECKSRSTQYSAIKRGGYIHKKRSGGQ